MTALLVLAATAHAAAGTGVGVGLSAGYDLPSADSGDFGVAPGLWVPVRLGLADWGGLRATVSGQLGAGHDRVSWAESTADGPIRVFDEDHFSLAIEAAATIGPEVVFPVGGPIKPYLGVEAGPGLAGTYHALSGAASVLIDPEQNNVGDPGNVDPYTLQPVLATDAHFGVRGGGSVGWWAEAGLSSMWLGRASLQKSPEALDAEREGFAWNPVRLGIGIDLRL